MTVAVARNGPALEVSDLAVGFAGPRGVTVEAVRGVALRVDHGRVLSIIGESGSGKSTVLLAIAGLLGPAARVSGDLRLGAQGENLLAPGAVRRGIAGRLIGMVFQNPGASLNPVLSIGAQIDEVVAAHQGLRGAAARARTLDLLDRVGIGDARRRAEAFPHQLSGGLKQRVVIAAALAGQPRLILADEPTTALDATVQAQILDLLLDLVDREGVALVLVTHDMAVAAAVADEVAVMYAGRVVEQGPARKAPAHPYARALAAAALPLQAGDGAAGDTTRQFAELPAAGGTGGSGCDFAPRCAHATEVCRASRPPLLPFDAGRVACFHAGIIPA